MKISVIIPCFNSEKYIREALDSLANQTVLPEEVIVIDNGSTDKTVNIIHEFINNHKNINIITDVEFKKGPGAARNKGIWLSTCDIIAFTDSDCRADKEWIANIKKQFFDPEVVAVGGTVYIDNPQNTIEKYQTTLQPSENNPEVHFLHKNDIFKGNFLVTNNCAYKSNMIKKINGFDESFFEAGEDADLNIRFLNVLSSSNKILINIKKIKIFHKPRKTLKQLLKQLFTYRLGFARVMKVHFKNKIIFSIPFLSLLEKDNNKITAYIEFKSVIFTIITAAIFVLSYAVSYKFLMLLLFLIFLYSLYNFNKFCISLKKINMKINIYDKILIIFIIVLIKIFDQFIKTCASIKYKIIFY